MQKFEKKADKSGVEIKRGRGRPKGSKGIKVEKIEGAEDIKEEKENKESKNNYREEHGYILHKSCTLVTIEGKSVRRWKNQQEKNKEEKDNILGSLAKKKPLSL